MNGEGERLTADDLERALANFRRFLKCDPPADEDAAWLGDYMLTDGAIEADVRAVLAALRPQPKPEGVREAVDWRDMNLAPKDGTPIWALCVHQNHQYARAGDKADWIEVVLAHWTDHNNGGWTWYGLAGQFVAWMPTNKPDKPLSLPALRGRGDV